jgi:gamma-glutamyltranspeptidase/glutathione hydrolase
MARRFGSRGTVHRVAAARAHHRRARRRSWGSIPRLAARSLRGGRRCGTGDRLVQPELASTLSRIAAEGRGAFFTGTIAQQLS